MAIETVDQLLARMPAAQHLMVSKVNAATKGSGYFHSLFRVAGNPDAGASNQTVEGEVPTKETPGALNFASPLGGLRSYLAGLVLSVGQPGMLTLIDRLWHNGDLVANITSDQAVNGIPIDRHSSGEGVEIWGEVLEVFGSTNTEFQVTYTNSAGVEGRVATYSWTHGAPAVGQAFKFKLQDGDTGAISIESFKCTVSTGSAGELGLVLVKRHGTVPMEAGKPVDFDAMRLKLPEIEDSACLSFMQYALTESTGALIAELSLVQG